MKMADKITRKKVIENYKNGTSTPVFLVFHNKENDSFIIRKERSPNQNSDGILKKDSPNKDSPKKDPSKQKLTKVL